MPFAGKRKQRRSQQGLLVQIDRLISFLSEELVNSRLLILDVNRLPERVSPFANDLYGELEFRPALKARTADVVPLDHTPERVAKDRYIEHAFDRYRAKGAKNDAGRGLLHAPQPLLL